MTRTTQMESEDTEVYDTKRLRPKVGRIPATLRLLNENNADVAYHDNWSETSTESRKGDTQFMLLLVTLFAIVNLTLVTLLNYKNKSTATQPVAAQIEKAAPAASVATSPVPPAPLPAPPPVVQELPTTITPPTPDAYITPASPNSTKTIAAPVHAVTVTEHTAPPQAATENLTLIPTPDIAPEAIPTISPAAGTPPVNTHPPETATQDLLSVINKD